jgi:hypothetical protein
MPGFVPNASEFTASQSKIRDIVRTVLVLTHFEHGYIIVEITPVARDGAERLGTANPGIQCG